MKNKKLASNNPGNEDSSAANQALEDIFTYRRHSIDYFTVDGVTLRTGYSSKRDWYLLCIRELVDNGVDFLSKNYKGSDKTVIDVDIFKDDKFFRLKIRNSNYKNIPVFSNLAAIFDYEMRYGSKQDVHIISRGMLGDALKQILAFEYILIQVDNDERGTFEDKQPKHPLIIRHNRKEFKVYLTVDKVRQTAIVKVEETLGEGPSQSDTEIELILPVVEEVKYTLDRKYIEDFCKRYPLFTTDITFRFNITDNSNYYYHYNKTSTNNKSRRSSFVEDLVTAGLAESPKATINIEYQTLHPISNESWNKQNSVHSYTPEEFKRRIITIDPKQATKTQIKIYDVVVATYREGTNLKKAMKMM